ncbi:MAG: hypothetical protein JXB32_19180 [Deltaproteobacteria bacterium]|nr:hypothetical protein [Deltaproteobacteria bacterium]
MRHVILVWVGFALVGAFGGCKKQAEGDPRCRVFEQDPAAVSDRGALEEIRAAWEDVERVRFCAQEAARTVGEFTAEHRVAERLELVGRKLEELGATLEQVGAQAGAAGESVLGEARQTVERAREGAEQALDEAQRRVEEGLRAATGE